ICSFFPGRFPSSVIPFRSAYILLFRMKMQAYFPRVIRPSKREPAPKLDPQGEYALTSLFRSNSNLPSLAATGRSRLTRPDSRALPRMERVADGAEPVTGGLRAARRHRSRGRGRAGFHDG